MKYYISSVLPGLILSIAWLAPSPAGAQTAPVKAVWRAGYLSLSTYRGFECTDAKSAVDEVLDMVGARNVRSLCRWSWGLDADWESLFPLSDADRKRVSLAVASPLSASRETGPTGWLSGLGRGWEEPSALAFGQPPEVVEGVWNRAGFQRYFSGSGSRACQIYSEALDEVLGRLAVRKIRETVFCNNGSGYISLDFEYLAPASLPERSPAAAKGAGLPQTVSRR